MVARVLSVQLGPDQLTDHGPFIARLRLKSLSARDLRRVYRIFRAILMQAEGLADFQEGTVYTFD